MSQEEKNDTTNEELNPSVDPVDTENAVANPPAPSADESENDDDIAALADQVTEKLEEKKGEPAKYTQEQVDGLFKKWEAKFNKNRDQDDDDYIDLLDPDVKKGVFIRLGRLKNKAGEYKFVVGLKNINTDPYVDQEITVQNIENPNKKGELIPWAEFIFEDGDSMLYPYLAFMNRTNGVWAEVIKREEEDVSEKFGTVDLRVPDESNEWSTQNTGKKVLAKAVKYKTTYICKEIKTGKELKVTDDVVNKAEAPYSDLKKYLEDNK